MAGFTGGKDKVDYHSEKHKELSEQLTTWWSTQTDFQTKKALAGTLKVHPDTLGDYFSGRRFPKPNIANRLYELSHFKRLRSTPGEITFTCKLCGKPSSIEEMRVTMRFFPPLPVHGVLEVIVTG